MSAVRSRILLILQNVPRAAVERVADGGEGLETDGGDLVVLDLGEVDVGDADALGQLVQRHLALHHHAVQAQYDLSHGAPLR